jgi:hypothetical protein
MMTDEATLKAMTTLKRMKAVSGEKNQNGEPKVFLTGKWG